jgi:hypothetical protein
VTLVTTPVPIAGNIQPSAEERLLRVIQAYFYCFADGSCLEVLFPIWHKSEIISDCSDLFRNLQPEKSDEMPRLIVH